MLGALICKWKGHNFRKARKGQDKDFRHCARCPVKKLVRHRKAKEQSE